ncbi:GNAT family N-acetyltransferase [Flavihumibacter sp. ZG627]|uniref:GNAT family N-acetyltransferase n=1 Tax=Flavihumibacter sp. ZG627 TaxID=1463156 RepID=UPI00057D54EA|nr:GNAT family N-acetyltransferase [Flavihumibacter sp. ZG627]KIC90200.1 acetyltransferase [Flavihumibacter sp. ZG627]
MIEYRSVSNIDELNGILALQENNLKDNLPAEVKSREGFLTIKHDLATLQAMHDLCPSVIAAEHDEVIGYALVMPVEARELIPMLEPMFSQFDTLEYKDKPLGSYRYYVMGQVCVHSNYRGLGVFDGLYNMHKRLFSPIYDFVITEISVNNTRSIRAHERVGFRTLHKHHDQTDDWLVVLWDWNDNA